MVRRKRSPHGRGSVEAPESVEGLESDDGFFITTTTGNLDFVEQWLEWWLAGAGWDVQVSNLTSARAAVNLAGPKARDVLSALTSW